LSRPIESIAGDPLLGPKMVLTERAQPGVCSLRIRFFVKVLCGSNERQFESILYSRAEGE
jgi:hypothetical protein